jgi:adenylyltransferase/sulfurtransferase
MTLSDSERERYKRQMMLPGWGEETQLLLRRKTAFIAGAGGLGSPVATYLAVAGVGRLVLCDFDAPEYSNLNRQILHDPTRLGVNKAVSAQISLRALNPDIEVVALPTRIDEDNVRALLEGADIVLDCMDNFPTRYLLGEACLELDIPLVHGAVWGLDGRLTFVHAPRTPCLRCLVPEAPPKEVFPVLGATPGVIGCLQALEALKCLTGLGEPLAGQLLLFEGATVSFRKLRLRRDPSCPTCSGR